MSDVATLEDGREFLRAFGWTPGSVQPPLALPTIDTGRSIGICCACDRPVAEFGPRHAGWTYNTREVLVHYECATTIHGHTQTQDDNAGRGQRVNPDQHVAYRRALESIRTPTLYSMVFAYDEASPNDRSADMAWKIIIVRDEIENRRSKALNGETIKIDDRLRAAAQHVDRLAESDDVPED